METTTVFQGVVILGIAMMPICRASSVTRGPQVARKSGIVAAANRRNAAARTDRLEPGSSATSRAGTRARVAGAAYGPISLLASWSYAWGGGVCCVGQPIGAPQLGHGDCPTAMGAWQRQHCDVWAAAAWLKAAAKL